MNKRILINGIISIQNYTNGLYMINVGKSYTCIGAMSYSQYVPMGQKALMKILSQMLQFEKKNNSQNYYRKMIKECL